MKICKQSALTNKLMIRVTNYFDTQIRVPISGAETDRNPGLGFEVNGTSSAFQDHLQDAASTKVMSKEQVSNWYGKILEGVKQRYRKLQRLARQVCAVRLDHISTAEIFYCQSSDPTFHELC